MRKHRSWIAVALLVVVGVPGVWADCEPFWFSWEQHVWDCPDNLEKSESYVID